MHDRLSDGFSFNAVTADELRGYADAQIALFSRTRTVLSVQAKAMARWLAAGLLAVDAGAAFATMAAATHAHNRVRLGMLFTSGIVVVLLNGGLIRIMAARHDAFLLRAQGYWAQVAKDGMQLPGEEQALWRLSRMALREGIAFPIPAILSIAAFAWAYRLLNTA